jgi:enterochelin esterase-like enzyme
MKKWWTGLIALLSLCTSVSVFAQPMPKVTSGTIERIANMPSKFVDARHVDVWLPDRYAPGRRYSVLYMHDGQMLFDASTTWNKQAWEVPATLSRLIKDGRIPETIVVGIWNNDKFRPSEYFPEKFLSFLNQPIRKQLIDERLQGQPRADRYLRFLVEELKPAIDQRFLTRPEREHTFVMGSSMGGLISIYAMNEYPQIFGGAAGMSTHWVGSYKANAAIPLAAFNYLRDHLASPETHRLYMDRGTAELDALYGPYQTFIDEIVRDQGYTEENWVSRTFEGEGHNEQAWAKRLDDALIFLMGKQ